MSKYYKFIKVGVVKNSISTVVAILIFKCLIKVFYVDMFIHVKRLDYVT